MIFFKLSLERMAHTLRKRDLCQLSNDRDLNSPKLKIKNKKCCLCEDVTSKLYHLKCVTLGKSFSHVKW